MRVHPIRRSFSILTISAALIGCLLALPGLASAADTYAKTATGCAATSWGSGGSDENGTLYSACGATVIRFDRSGAKLPNLVLSTATTDVAPSPNGSSLYVFQNDTVVRYDHQPATDTFVKNLAWTISTFPFDGKVWPVRGNGIAVDAWGDLYISNGAWYANAANVVAKFHADGSFVTAFGGWGNGVGEFNVNMGLAVSRDGRTIYVAEQTNGRIQRFDYNNGRYAYTLTFGSTDTNCVGGSTLSAPYDVGIDPWGFIYVMDTSCARVKKFTGNGVFIAIVASNGKAVAHGLAVGRHGEFYVGQWGQLFTRTVDNPEPGATPAITPLPIPTPPDITAPIVTTATIPASTTTQTITTSISATDNVSVTDMRFANEDGNWSAWTAYATPVNITLTAGYGTKGVTVQVRDKAGNESNTVYVTTSYRAADTPPPVNDIADPVLNSATIPALTSNRTITVITDASDDTGVTRIRFANEDGNWGAWQPYSTSTSITLSANSGPKLVFVQVGDAYWHESVIMQLHTTYQVDTPLPPPAVTDTKAPALTDATVPTTSTTPAIAVGISATDNVGVAQVRFANEDGNWTGWQTYSPQMAWTLSDGYTFKLVFIQVRDAAGNESAVLQRKSQLVLNQPAPAGPVDAADPVLTTVTVPNPATSREISIALDATDDIGVTEARFANEDGNWTAWQPFAASMTWTLSPGNLNKLVFTQVRDASGRESNVIMSRTLLAAPNNGA